MSRVFAYCRVSTNEQTTDNQVQEIAAAGFQVTPQRTITETVSGSLAASEREGWGRLMNKLEAADILIVTKLDRLGRNAMDVRATVEALTAMGVKVHCLALGGMDLTSAAGKMTMGVINAMAEFERDLLIERTHAGLSRAKADGKTLGRPQNGVCAPAAGGRGSCSCCSARPQDQPSDHHAYQRGRSSVGVGIFKVDDSLLRFSLGCYPT
jgi:putative DNA-invertase from lambdoid prophage Rac